MDEHREQSSETNQRWPCLLTQYILGGKIADKSKVEKSGWYFLWHKCSDPSFITQSEWVSTSDKTTFEDMVKSYDGAFITKL